MSQTDCLQFVSNTPEHAVSPASTAQLACVGAKFDTHALNSIQTEVVLVMDDERIIRDISSMMLESLGYRVKTCAHGEEAIEIYQEEILVGTQFRAIVLDIMVAGGMGGKEAAAKIREINPEANIIISSGYCNDPLAQEFEGNGFQAFLPKPYKISDLAAVMNSLPVSGA